MNQSQLSESTALLGQPAVDMLLRTHQDSLWMLENLGVRCTQPDLVEAFKKCESSGLAYVYGDRVYLMNDLVEKCLETVPGIDDFFVPKNSLFIGGIAPYLYDDVNRCGGLVPTPEDVERISRISDQNDIVAGMGSPVQLKDEARQIEIMTRACAKPLYFSVTNEKSLAVAREAWQRRGNFMVGFGLTKPPLELNESVADIFVRVVKAGLPVLCIPMPMAGISAPYCYNGVLAVTQAEALFGICAAQLINPGLTCVNGGLPSIADPRDNYNPNYGRISHQVLNILLNHLNMILDLPANQSAGTTNEEHPTPKACQDTRQGLAICKKYGFHMIRHPFGFLKSLVDFSIKKLELCIEIAEETTADQAPDIRMPVYDERGLESIRNTGLGLYMNDPLTTANLDRVFFGLIS